MTIRTLTWQKHGDSTAIAEVLEKYSIKNPIVALFISIFESGMHEVIESRNFQPIAIDVEGYDQDIIDEFLQTEFAQSDKRKVFAFYHDGQYLIMKFNRDSPFFKINIDEQRIGMSLFLCGKTGSGKTVMPKNINKISKRK